MSNKIHHIWFLLDSSGSMGPHLHTVPKVMDEQIKSLSEDSKNHPGEETRASVFMFSNPGYGAYSRHVDYECILYDMDTLHVPSIQGKYRIEGGTALCDAVVRIIGDMKLIPEQYGKHFHLLYVLTDGEELHSTAHGRQVLPGLISSLPDNFTIAAFTPSATGKHYLTRLGFPAGNISIWDPSAQHAVEEVGYAMASASSGYMATTRSGAASSVSNLFEMNAPKAAELKKDAVPLTPGSYYFENVTAADLAQISGGRLDQFMELKARQEAARKGKVSTYRYIPGKCYYEFTQRARVQHYKQLAIAILDKDRNEEDVYVGEKIREKLGLPAESERKEVRISPGAWSNKGYSVFVLSTSNNRKLLPGTRVLVMR